MEKKENESERYCMEYVWIDGDGGLRSKIRITHTNEFKKLVWNFDGSSTNQATTGDSEVELIPVQSYPNPLLIKIDGLEDIQSYFLLCKCKYRDGREDSYDTAIKIMNLKTVVKERPWFGLEQEYFLVDKSTHLPVGFGKDVNGMIVKIEPVKQQGKYYCGVGASNIIGRNIAERHMMVCLKMGIQISGINAEVAYGQWEYQVGPVEGIEAANQLWISRYILQRIAEEEGYDITFEPKPITWGSWNGSGCHTNFSTKSMREKNGIQVIKSAMEKLKIKHKEHIEVYGSDNHLRLTGTHETSSMEEFTYGIGSRNTSVRIGYQTESDGKGYFEDRRPSSNMNPYLVCAKICETILT